MNQPSSSTLPAAGERALVIGGGGSIGNAWVIGVLAGLSDAGVDVTSADLTIGTSAGSTTAAQAAVVAPSELYAATVGALPHRPPAGAPSDRRRAPNAAVVDHLDRARMLIASSADPADMRRRFGASGLELAAAAGDSWRDQWRATVASRLPGADWPDRRLLITAVDAETGDPVVFDRESGVDLVDAVAASCSSGPAYRIGDRRYIDGGYRSNAENADLAAGFRRVLVLSPFGGKTLLPLEWGLHLAAQVGALRAGGSQVGTIFPEPDAEDLFGANAMNPSNRAPAARAGYEQGLKHAAVIAELWR